MYKDLHHTDIFCYTVFPPKVTVITKRIPMTTIMHSNDYISNDQINGNWARKFLKEGEYPSTPLGETKCHVRVIRTANLSVDSGRRPEVVGVWARAVHSVCQHLRSRVKQQSLHTVSDTVGPMA